MYNNTNLITTFYSKLSLNGKDCLFIFILNSVNGGNNITSSVREFHNIVLFLYLLSGVKGDLK